ncbi:MAG: hypothetical protein Q9225_003627 [Loekoesia sp. 1 TL-2023]
MALAPSTKMARPNIMSIGHVLNSKEAPAAHFSKGFSQLPPEINQEIASYLCDKDLASFARVQRETCDAVLPTNAGHWRIRFKAQFDFPDGKTPASIQADYKLRKQFLNKPIHFKVGKSSDEADCLKAIKQLIVECFSSSTIGSSNNMLQLWRYMKKSNLLHDGVHWSSSVSSPDRGFLYGRMNEMVIVQTLFFGWTLYFATTDNLSAAYPMSLRLTAYNIEWAQNILTSPPKAKLVLDCGEINVKILAALTEFWKFHLVINNEGALHQIFLELPGDEWPNAFRSRLRQGEIRLGHKWKGALFHPGGNRLSHFVRDHVHHHVFTDGFYTGGDELLELDLDFAPAGVQWPDVFETEVHGLPDNLGEDLALWVEPPQLAAVNKPADKACRPKFTKVLNPLQRPTTDEAAYNAKSPSRVRQELPQNFIFPGRSNFLPKSDFNGVQYKMFTGTGDANCGDRGLCFAGIVHPLPPQAGIPGWQRFTMVSFEKPMTGTASKGYLDAYSDDLKIYMQYEGVILPGASTILGRFKLGKAYRDPDLPVQIAFGPFIYWNVPDDILDDNEDDDEDDEEVDDGDNGEHGNGDQDDTAEGDVGDNAGIDGYDGVQGEAHDGAGEGNNVIEFETSDDIWTTQEEDEDEQYWLAALKALHEGK